MLSEYKATRRILRSLRPNDIDKPKVNSMISSTSYVIDWLETGIRPGATRGIERRAGYEREIPCSHVLDRLQRPYSPISSVDDTKTRERVEEALSVLTERERECFVMFNGEGFSQGSIARMLGISQQAVSKNIAKAENRIKSIFKEPLHQSV